MSASEKSQVTSVFATPVQIGTLVELRYPTKKDRAEFVSLRQQSRKYLEKWEPVPPSGFDSFGNDGFDQELRLRRTHMDERLLIFERDEGHLVGKLSIGAITRGPLQSCYFGYWVAEPFAGRGYMSQAVNLGLRHAFRTLRLHRVEASIQPHNDASRSVLLNNDFVQEGYSCRFLKIRGKWCDHERWARYRQAT